MFTNQIYLPLFATGYVEDVEAKWPKETMNEECHSFSFMMQRFFSAESLDAHILETVTQWMFVKIQMPSTATEPLRLGWPWNRLQHVGSLNMSYDVLCIFAKLWIESFPDLILCQGSAEWFYTWRSHSLKATYYIISSFLHKNDCMTAWHPYFPDF